MKEKATLALVALLGLCAVGLSFAAEAQQSARLYRVGMLLVGSPTTSGISPDTFRKDLRDLGYIEGQNLVIDLRWAEGHLKRLPALAAELVSLKPDLIMAFTTDGALAAKQATATIPIVFMQVADPVRAGLVASLARPGGNSTGITDFSIELAAKKVELIRALAPNARRIGFLMSDSPTQPHQVNRIEAAAAAQGGVTVITMMGRSDDELERAFASFARDAVGGVIVPGGTQQGAQRPRIAELALKFKIPTVAPTRIYVEQGVLMSYGVNLPASYRLMVRYVDQILKGAKPSELAVEQPPKFELVMNLKTAKALGLTVPQSLLLRADEVIQ